MTSITPDLDVCLRERFALEQFRPGQRDVIETVLACRDCLCVMPTGGGKSLCYQLPALLQNGVTLVVSPLIALMKDQVDVLRARGIRATMINSTVDAATQAERIAATERGEFELVYVAPERFRSHRFNEAMSRTRVALLAVDEAHCISEWGHDFRPDYTRLGLARKRLGNPPTIALTATATDHVRRDICDQLELRDPQIFITGFDRPNLRYEVRYASGESAKQGALGEILAATPGSGIIYCASRKKCEEVAEFLRDEIGRDCLVYHAGLERDERRQAQERFMTSRDLVVAATVAFGLGVDKPDIRFVIHYNMPGTIEAYYQEAGRAGRDGLESRCVLLYSPSDRFIQEFFIESEYPSREVVGAIYQFLAAQQAEPIELTQEQIKERLRLSVSEMGVGASLKLLEGAGVLERLRPRENMAIVRIDSEVSLVGLLPANAAVQRRVLSALERLVETARGDDAYFSPHALAARLELEPHQFTRAVHELCEKLPVEYVPPFRGNAVRMLDRSCQLDALDIDFEALERRKQNEYRKLDQVIEYACGRECRRRAILAYFGDRSPVQCGHCDNCHAGPTRPRAGTPRHAAADEQPVASEEMTVLVRKILSGIARAQGRTRGRVGFGKTTIAAMLTGSRSEAIKRWRLDQLSTYGLLEEFTQADVGLLIDNLIAAGCVTTDEVERFRPVIRISPTGLEVMKGEREPDVRWRLPPELHAKLRRRKSRAAPASAAAPHSPAVHSVAPRARSIATTPDVEHPAGVPATRARQLPTDERGVGVAGVESSSPQQGEAARRARELPASQPAQPQPAQPQPAPNDHYWTWRLLDRGFTQLECAAIRGIDETTVLAHAVAAARDGRAVPLDAFLTTEQMAVLDSALASGRDLPPDIEHEHVTLFRLARKR